jgi:hypothetical protein
MKKYLMLSIAAFVSLTHTTFAQQLISKTKEQKQVPWPFPDKLVKPASALILPAHVPDIKKPFVTSLSYIQGVVNEARAKCPAQKSASLMLNAERLNNFTANLKWETKNAFKASGFDIEKSLADTFHFVAINFAAASAGKGSGNKKDYQLPDRNDYSGISFYRIKQLNIGTGYLYSNIVAVKGYEVASLNIYPIPASDRVWIDLAAKQNGNTIIMLYDASGKIVQRQSLDCTKDLFIKKSLDVSKLVAGIYQVQILMPDKNILNGKFIKQ